MIENLNADCFCPSIDQDALRRALPGDLQIFAALPVFISRRHVDAMAAVVDAVERVVALPHWPAALPWAPEVARFDPGARGVFMGYDFHLGRDGPRLIEINTNAGGALLNAALGRAQRACCKEIEALVNGPIPAAALEPAFVDMFLAEWQAAGRAGRPGRIAIVDDEPERQFMYPEFQLFAQLFRRAGIEASVLAPEALAFDGGALRDAAGPVDLVYNRLTDFSLSAPAHGAIRAAYLARAAVVTPHPRAHALYADKRNLAVLTDPERLRTLGVEDSVTQTLVRGIARTELVTAEAAERLWGDRRRLFFKPALGYGSKAAYRGDKLTRRVWGDILAGNYVAQELVPPSERRVGPDSSMKVDVRNYVYAGKVQLLAARLYQGQTTNLRTAGGGFAPVLTTALLTTPNL